MLWGWRAEKLKGYLHLGVVERLTKSSSLMANLNKGSDWWDSSNSFLHYQVPGKLQKQTSLTDPIHNLMERGVRIQ
jgi:hypothetical protein